jgi:hypothetical protein
MQHRGGKVRLVDSGCCGGSRRRAAAREHHQHWPRSWVPLAQPGKTWGATARVPQRPWQGQQHAQWRGSRWAAQGARAYGAVGDEEAHGATARRARAGEGSWRMSSYARATQVGAMQVSAHRERGRAAWSSTGKANGAVAWQARVGERGRRTNRHTALGLDR